MKSIRPDDSLTKSETRGGPRLVGGIKSAPKMKLPRLKMRVSLKTKFKK